jgi:hypothetical protein
MKKLRHNIMAPGPQYETRAAYVQLQLPGHDLSP